MTIGLVLVLWGVVAGVVLAWPRAWRRQDADFVSARWRRNHIYRAGKESHHER